MRQVAPDWEAVYRPLLGRTLDAIAFMPLQGSDTLGVVSDIGMPDAGFSGALMLAFSERPSLFVTWAQLSDYQFGLIAGGESSWEPHALDLINVRSQEPWASLCCSELRSLAFYTLEEMEEPHVVAIEHQFESSEATAAVLWVGTASGHKVVTSGDDLVVTIDAVPASTSALIQLGIIH